MSEWKKVTLGELIDSGECAIYDNLRKPLSKIERNKMKYGNLYPYYGAAGVIDFINNYCFDGYYLLIAEDGTITSDGTKPMLQLANGKFWVSNHAHVLQCKNEWKTKFLYYALLNVDINPYITGSVQPKLNQENLFSIPLLIPKSELEQRAIASVLSSIDDKIDLLQRENKTLEAMAETLFRQWFIEEAEDDWQRVPLSFLGNIVCGKTPPKQKKEYFGGNIPFIKIPDMQGNIFIFQTSDTLTEEGKQLQNNKTLPPKSICVSCIATVGLVSMNAKESQTNQQINSIIPKKDFYRYYLYLFMKNSVDLLKAMASGGTITLNLNTSDFSKIKVILPDENKLTKFHEIVEPMFDRIYINYVQIRTLTQLRDTLLPKLMSGEVRVDLCQS